MNKSVVISTCFLIFLTAFTQYARAHTDGGVVVKNAWVREAPPTSKVLAAYLTIENHTSREKTLTAVSSSFFQSVEIHNTIINDGMASMQQQNTVIIPAQGNIVFQPNGLHFMLINPESAVTAGKRIGLTLTFSDGSKSVTSAKVKKTKPGMTDHSHHNSAHKETHKDRDSGHHDHNSVEPQKDSSHHENMDHHQH